MDLTSKGSKICSKITLWGLEIYSPYYPQCPNFVQNHCFKQFSGKIQDGSQNLDSSKFFRLTK